MAIDVLRVSSKSNPNSVAGALAGVLRHRGSAEIQVVGAGALNQAVKAVVITRGFLAPTGQDLACRPAPRRAGGDRGGRPTRTMTGRGAPLLPTDLRMPDERA